MRNKKRYLLIDSIRGAALISMILYHAIWDMVWLFGADMPWFKTSIEFIWQQSICWTFILVSGFSWSFGKRHGKSGVQILAASILISGVTMVFMPNSLVLFGVLSLLGTATLIMIPLDKIFKRINPYTGVFLFFFLFLIMRNINEGSLGFGKLVVCHLPKSWYANWFTAYLGFPPKEFFSTDYFSVLPWFFLFVTGYFLFHIFRRKKLMKIRSYKGIGVLNWLGQHSLFIYLLHQPVVYGILYLIFCIF